QSQSPGDYDVARLGLQVYRYTEDLDKARDFVEVAVKANPNDEKLKVLHRGVQDLTPEGVAKQNRIEVENNPDPFKKALGLAGLARRANQPEEEIKWLKKAQRS